MGDNKREIGNGGGDIRENKKTLEKSWEICKKYCISLGRFVKIYKELL